MGLSRHLIDPTDVDKLKQMLSGTNAKILTRSDTGYQVSVERRSRAAEQATGGAIVPSTAEDTSIAIKCSPTNRIWTSPSREAAILQPAPAAPMVACESTATA